MRVHNPNNTVFTGCILKQSGTFCFKEASYVAALVQVWLMENKV